MTRRIGMGNPLHDDRENNLEYEEDSDEDLLEEQEDQ